MRLPNDGDRIADLKSQDRGRESATLFFERLLVVAAASC